MTRSSEAGDASQTYSRHTTHTLSADGGSPHSISVCPRVKLSTPEHKIPEGACQATDQQHSATNAYLYLVPGIVWACNQARQRAVGERTAGPGTNALHLVGGSIVTRERRWPGFGAPVANAESRTLQLGLHLPEHAGRDRTPRLLVRDLECASAPSGRRARERR